MADQFIKYSDLFDASVASGLDALTKQVQGLQSQFATMLDETRKRAEELQKALSGGSSAGGKGGTGQAIKETEELAKAYEKLTGEEKVLATYAAKLVTTQKELTKVGENVKAMAREQETSFNRLKAEYDTGVKALNALTKEEVENTARGQYLVYRLKEIRTEMTALKAATGDMRLQVGNYTKAIDASVVGSEEYRKAMNGINIATQQVLREMPTLANSLSQFIIAIGNNVPILVDNLQRGAAVTGAFSTAIKGMLKAIFSWQTVLLVVLTILPGLIKKINDKKKAQQEDNEVTRASVAINEKLAKISGDVSKAVNGEVSSLRTLYRVARDTNRSMEERVAIGETIKNQYQEAFKNYSAEEIALGKAKVAYSELTDALMKVAKARAYQNKIQELESQYIDQEALVAKLKEEKEAREAATKAISKEARETIVDADARGFYTAQIDAAQASQDEATQKYIEADSALQKLDNRIAELRDKIDAKGLAQVFAKDAKGTKQATDKASDYWYEYLQARFEAIEDADQREYALLNLRYNKEIDTYQKILDEGKEAGTLDAQQQKYLTSTITYLVNNRERELFNLTQKWAKAREDAQEKATNDEYARLIKEADNRLKIATNQAYTEHQNVVRRNKDIGLAEVGYWQERIDLAKQYGEKYANEIETFESNLARARERAVLGTEKSGKTAKKREGGLLYKILFGEAVKEDKPSEQIANYISQLKSLVNTTIQYMNELIDKRLEIAEAAEDAAQREADAAKSALDYELEARANGYANNVEYARREYEEKLKLQKAATKESERLQKIQEAVDTAQQVSSLVTATAGILAGYSTIPIVGQVLGALAIAAMWGTFLAAKATAYSIAGTKKYGDGMSEYIDYGGSHASGNDVDFGRDKKGNRRRIERGEMVAVINKRNVDKYGVSGVSNIIDSLNKGVFENRYGQAFEGTNIVASGADLSKVESGLGSLVEQGQRKVYVVGNKVVEVNGNVKKTIIRS